MRSAEDDGLGMVTPMHEVFEELPTGIRTRMTLTLLDDVKLEHLLKDFQSIPDSLLLFLGKLQDLTIETYPLGGATSSVTYSKHEYHKNGQDVADLVKSVRNDLGVTTVQQKFYMLKQEVRGLPYDAARVDKKQKSIDHATIILAFPVDKDDVPVLEQQHVFAFLPLRRAGFKFLIQSDFVTQANREDVVHTPRNEAILAGVARAFRDAVLRFCNHESLRYQWMRYLPDDSISDDFWGNLWTRIRDLLKQTPILRSWSEEGLHYPTRLRKLLLANCDKYGEPLLRDLREEIYLSTRYSYEDVHILRRLGTDYVTWDNTVDRLRHDLGNPFSKWKSMSSEEDWRTRLCKLLLKALDDTLLQNPLETLKMMPLIPVQDGKWVQAQGRTVYFPNTGDIPIPTDTTLELVHTAVADNKSWRKLLSRLEVNECPPETVVASITRLYRQDAEASISLDSSIAHLRYLYWYLPNKIVVLAPEIRLLNHEIKPVPSNEYLYFNDLEDEDSLSQLFQKSQDGDMGNPGYSINFLHPGYLHAVNVSASRNGKSWLWWLEHVAGVQRNPHIYAKHSTKLSGEFQYIIDHRSEKLLWILKRFWSIYEEQIEPVAEVLMTSEVKAEAGYRVDLNLTFLPLPRLKRLVKEYCVPDFPFISMSPQPHGEDTKEWDFLECLNVTIDDNIYFYLHAMIEMSVAYEAGCDPLIEDAVFGLYDRIQKQCIEDPERVSYASCIPTHQLC